MKKKKTKLKFKKEVIANMNADDIKGGILPGRPRSRLQDNTCHTCYSVRHGICPDTIKPWTEDSNCC